MFVPYRIILSRHYSIKSTSLLHSGHFLKRNKPLPRSFSTLFFSRSPVPSTCREPRRRCSTRFRFTTRELFLEHSNTALFPLEAPRLRVANSAVLVAGLPLIHAGTTRFPERKTKIIVFVVFVGVLLPVHLYAPKLTTK